MRLNDFINDMPFLIPEMVGEELYSDYQKATEWLKEHYSGKVTGLWHILVPADDGGLQAIIRFEHELPYTERIDIHGGVFDFLQQESLFDVVGNDFQDIDVMLNEFFSPQSIVCVFDNNREKSDVH